MTLRTIKRLITGLAGLAMLFTGASLIAVPKAHALYCGGKTLPPGNWTKTNLSCSPCATLYVQKGQDIKDGFCLDNRPAAPLAEPGPANDAR